MNTTNATMADAVRASPSTELLGRTQPCARHRYTTTLPATAVQHRDDKTLQPLGVWGIWTRRQCACGAVKGQWAKLRYVPRSRREAWDAFRPAA